MNKVILIGRLIKDVETRVAGSTKVGRYTLAVDRKFKKDGEPTADFIPCVVFGKSAEFAEKYFKKGTKISVEGSIRTGSYKNKDGQTVYTTDIMVQEQNFVESKAQNSPAAPTTSVNDFIPIGEGIADSDLPF